MSSRGMLALPCRKTEDVMFFLHQNTTMQYKSSNNNLRTLVEFYNQLINAVFAPTRGFSPLSRATGKCSAPHIPSLNI